MRPGGAPFMNRLPQEVIDRYHAEHPEESRTAARERPLFHGTEDVLQVGDIVRPASEVGCSNWQHLDKPIPGYDPTKVYVSHDEHEGAGLHGGHVYRVEPMGPVEPDPEVEHWKRHYRQMAERGEDWHSAFGAESDEQWHDENLGVMLEHRTVPRARVVEVRCGPNCKEHSQSKQAAKRQLDPKRLTQKHLDDINQIVEDTRMEEGAGGQCAFVAEQLQNKYGWGMNGGYYHHADGRVIGDHVWNVHEPSGTIIDATADQFAEGHHVRVVHPDDPEHARYQFSPDEDEDVRRTNEARGHMDQHGDYWWTGGPTEHSRAYDEKVKRYESG